MRAKFCAIAVALSLMSAPTWAAPIIEVGDHSLLADTAGQTIGIYVRGGGDVTAFNLCAQIGDGLGADYSGGGPEPIIESVSYENSIWQAHAHSVMGAPLGGNKQFAQESVAFNTSGDSVLADGLLLTLIVDTTGFSAGESFDLSLKGTQITVDSNFVAQGGTKVDAEITNGTISIVPEPTTMAVLGLAGVLALRRRTTR